MELKEDRLPSDEALISPVRVSAAQWWASLAAIGLVFVELCWLVPWYLSLLTISVVAPTGQVIVVLGGIMLVGYFLAVLMERLRLLRVVELFILGAGLVCVLLLAEVFLLQNSLGNLIRGLAKVDPGAILVLFFVIWAWWRGFSLGLGNIHPYHAFRRFLLGLLMLVAYAFIGTRVLSQPVDRVVALGLLVTFLFVGLLSVMLARIAYIGLTQGVQKNPFDRRWLATTLSVLGLSVGLAALLGTLLTGQYSLLFDWLGRVFYLALASLIFILSLPGLALSSLLEPIGPWIRELLQSRPTATPNPFQSLYPQTYIPAEANNPNIVPIPPAAQALIFWAVILLLVGLLMARSRRSGHRLRNPMDEPESLLQRGQARSLFRRAWQAASEELANRLRSERRGRASARVREIYALLMELCEELDYPREPAQTPSEFLPDLGELFPQSINALTLVTETYNNIRYGEIPETESEIQRLENAWDAIRVEGERLKKSGEHKLKRVEEKEVLKTGL